MKRVDLKMFKTLLVISVMSCCLACGRFSYAQSAPNFALIPLKVDKERQLPLDHRVVMDIKVYDADTAIAVLNNWDGIETVDRKDNLLSLSISVSSTDVSKPTPEALTKFKANTFVIDFEEEAVQRVLADFSTEYSSEQSDANQLTTIGKSIEKFVAGYISEPTYIHSFSFASRVATSRSGDCTEYSVLTAALARALKIPARVIIGTIIVEGEDGVEAYGHAWSELWLDGQWSRIDAAMYSAEALKKFYLPAHILDNEGLGYALGLSKAIFNMPEQITIRS